MTVKKDDSGKWLVDLRPSGRSGKRFRKQFVTKAEALAYEKHILATTHNKEWLGLPEDRRHLSELIELWWKKSGQFKRTAENYKKKVILVCGELGDPKANKITPNLISEWQLNRLEKGHKNNTVRRLISCLSNVFTVLIETGDYTGVHPLKNIKKPIENKTFMSFLTTNQIDILLDAVKHDNELKKAVDICLSTGSRWRETIMLNANNLTPHKIQFTETKTGRPRAVPISKELYDSIYPNNGRSLFLGDPVQRLYKIMNKLALDIPKGQKAHILRHTFASHFMINGGNILQLQKILGHSNITQTMTYAHLSPEHLVDAIKLNPLINRQ